jgi:hypothetical protein
MQRKNEVTSGILFLVTGSVWLATAIRQIHRHNDLSWLSLISALLFIIAGALRLRAGIHTRKQPGDSPLSNFRQ